MEYKEAKRIALNAKGTVNACREYKAAYHFYDKKETERDGDNDVVVLKESGKSMNFTTFILKFMPEKKQRK